MDSEQLKQARKALGVTQARLAEQLGVTVGTVARWEMPANLGRWPVPHWAIRELRRVVAHQGQEEPHP